MAQLNNKELTTLPVGRLGLIPLDSCRPLGEKVNEWLVKWRKERENPELGTCAFEGYQRDSYIINVKTPRFGSGEGKGEISESVRGDDIYVMVDVCNHSINYTISGYTNMMSPDDHFQDLKRAIAAVGGKARRVNVIMPYLYESRQSKRIGRESLDCASALQELTKMGVENIITFDAHDQRVQNAIPDKSFENVMPTYQMIKALVNNVDDLKVDKDHLMVISPDEGALHRCIYFATQLGVNLGMFYKRRDYTRVVNGRNPIVEHQYLGDSVKGKDIIIVDDMISSGESMLEVAMKLKNLGCNRIFVCTTFGLFCNGLDVFDKAYADGVFYRVFTTNGVYQTPELLSREWYVSVELSKYAAYLIDTLNHDMSVSNLLDSSEKIDTILKNKGLKG